MKPRNTFRIRYDLHLLNKRLPPHAVFLTRDELELITIHHNKE
jgi:hypothetical protein